MRNRTKLFVSALVAGTALATAIPAQAQYRTQHSYPNSQDGRYDTNRDGRIDDRDGRYDTNRDGRIDARDGRYYDRDGGYDRNDRYDRDDRYDNRYDRDHQYRGTANAIWTQIEQLQRRVARNDGRDRISEREAAGLRNAVFQLRQQFRDFNRNGLSRRESQYLQQRINQIRSRLQYERRDNDGRRW